MEVAVKFLSHKYGVEENVINECVFEVSELKKVPVLRVLKIIVNMESEKSTTPNPQTEIIEQERNRKKAEALLHFFGISVTGLRPGETMIGNRTITKDCVMNYDIPKISKGKDLHLSVDDYIIPPDEKNLNYLRLEPDLWRLFLNRLNSIAFFAVLSDSEKEEWLYTHQSNKDVDISEFGGNIELVQLGKSDLVEKLLPEDLEDIMQGGWMKALDLRKKIPGKPGTNANRHTLFFLRTFWNVYVNALIVSETTHPTYNVCTGKIFPKGTKVEQNEVIAVFGKSETTISFGIKMNKNGLEGGLNMTTMTSLAKLYIRKKFPEIKTVLDSYVAVLIFATKNFTAGAYKSLLQKLIRFRPIDVDFSRVVELMEMTDVQSNLDDKINSTKPIYPSRINGCVVLVLTIAFLFANPGSFVPDIQRFVSGPESAAKRIVISVFEESCFELPQARKLLKLSMAAYLFQRLPNYVPTEKFIVDCFEIAISATRCGSYIAYEGDRISELLKHTHTLKPFGNINVPDTDEGALKLISFFSDEVKSFDLDLMMMRWCATHPNSRVYPEGWRKTTNEKRPDWMSFEHCFDQHWAPEIAYLYPRDMVRSLINDNMQTYVNSKPFHVLFRKLFHEVSGFNPRKNKSSKSLFNYLPGSFIDASKKAQLCLFNLKNGVNVQKLPAPNGILSKEYIKFKYTLDRSWIAGMLGPIYIGSALVTLHPRDIDIHVAVRKPARSVKSEKDTILSKEVEKKTLDAFLKALKTGIPLKACGSPIIEMKKSTLYYSGGKYYVTFDGEKVEWEEARCVRRQVPTFELDALRTIEEIASNGNANGDTKGICKNWKQRVIELMKEYTRQEIKRAVGYLSGFSKSFEINRISKDGGGTKYAVTFDDVGAYQFILRLTDIIPCCLRRRALSTIIFDVIDGPVFWVVRDFIAATSVINKSGNESNLTKLSVNWKEIGETGDRILHQHQTDILDAMKKRHILGKNNHIINATVGSGKTMVALEYLVYLSNRKELPNYVIYTLPSSAISTIIKECEAMGFKVSLIDARKTIPKTATDLKYRVSADGIKPNRILLVEHDHLRRLEDELLQISSNSIFIIDELHKCLNESKRTSVASNISKSCIETIGITGTPIIDTNTYKLSLWLKEITEFEVNDNNFWVAASAMITKKFDTGIRIVRNDICVGMTLSQQQAYSELVSIKMGGNNLNPSIKDFMKAMELCYGIATVGIINETMRLLKRGGVFVIAKSIDHADELKEGLIKRGVKLGDIFSITKGNSIDITDDAVKSGKVHDYRVVIAPINKSAGYTLTRLKSMVMGVYPSNNATREQLEGRTNRIGQTAKKIEFLTVHTGILTHIFQHHSDAWVLSNIVSTLGDIIVL